MLTSQYRLTNITINIRAIMNLPVKYCKWGSGPHRADHTLKEGRQHLICIVASPRSPRWQLLHYAVRTYQKRCALKPSTPAGLSHTQRPAPGDRYTQPMIHAQDIYRLNNDRSVSCESQRKTERESIDLQECRQRAIPTKDSLILKPNNCIHFVK